VTAPDPAAAVANARSYSSYESGMCLKWVRGPCWEVGSLYGSAIEAWQGARFKHPGDRTPPLGAPCFYSGGKYGHIVIWTGGEIRSTDCTSTGRVSDTDLDWPVRTWGQTYLGWAEDLNGILLPLEGDTMGLTETDLSNIAKRVNGVLGDYTAKGDPRDGIEDPEQGDLRLRQLEKKVDKILDKLS
jgi:hypothetical protein